MHMGDVIGLPLHAFWEEKAGTRGKRSKVIIKKRREEKETVLVFFERKGTQFLSVCVSWDFINKIKMSVRQMGIDVQSRSRAQGLRIKESQESSSMAQIHIESVFIFVNSEKKTLEYRFQND